MILFFAITIVISVLAYIDWKRTVLIWLPVSMLFNQCVCIRYVPPALTVVLAVNMAIAGIYVIQKSKLKNKLCQKNFLYDKSFKFYLVSYSFSMLFSVVPFTTVLTGTIKYFINTFIIVYLFHKALKTLADLQLFLKAALFVFVPIIALGLFEALYHDNPWLDMVYLASPDVDYILGKMYYIPPFLTYSGDVGMRFGMVRCYSFFNIHIAFGCACVLYLFLFLYFNQKGVKKGKILSTTSYLFASLLCIVGIILCNSKTPMVGLPFLIMAAIPSRIIFSHKGLAVIVFAIVAIVIALGCNQDLFNNFLALFDTKLQMEGGGSNVEMRAAQYKVGWDLFTQNPIFGNGVDSLSYIAKQTTKYSDILGSESSWLKILPQQGLLGVIAYLFLYKEMFIHMQRGSTRTTAFFYLTGLMLMETATGFMDFHIYAPAIVAVERYMQIKNVKNYQD